MRAVRRGALALAAAGLLCAAVPARACETADPPAQPLKVEGFYGDARHSAVDPARRAARDAAVAPYEAFVRAVQAGADAYRATGDAAAGRCALEGLERWARAGVLAGDIAPGQGEYERNWYLAGLALAWLKLKPLAAPAQQRVIERWLGALAARTLAFTEGRAAPANNLLYWAGLALAASALATGDEAAARRADAILAQGLAAIRPDGTLPLEMARGARALSYHAFAAEPLVAMAAIAAARGRAPDLAPLARLVARIAEGLADPAFFAQRAGAPQDMPAAWNLAFLILYEPLAPGGALPAHGTRTHFLGGDVAGTLEVIREQAGMRQH